MMYLFGKMARSQGEDRSVVTFLESLTSSLEDGSVVTCGEVLEVLMVSDVRSASRCVSVHFDGLKGIWLRRHVERGLEAADGSDGIALVAAMLYILMGGLEDGSDVTWRSDLASVVECFDLCHRFPCEELPTTLCWLPGSIQ